MTREEAYNTMQEGIPISHKDFGEDEFLYMDENYIIRDEDGYEFEASWDVQETQERFKTGWYIYKNKKKIEKKKAIPFKRKAEYEIEEKQLISHMPRTECAGKDICLQYNLAGETACVMCDCTEDDRTISSRDFTPAKLIELNSEAYYKNTSEEKIDDKEEDIVHEQEKKVKRKRNRSLFNRIFRSSRKNR